MSEGSPAGISVYSPDLPGCVATGATRAAVESTAGEAIELHLEGLRAEGVQAPAPHSFATTIGVAA